MPKKILICNIFGIGDVLFTYPMMENIKKYDPSLQIGYVCNIRTVSMLQKNPHIDRLFVYEKDEYKKLSKQSRLLGFRYLKKLFQQIKTENYDCVLDVSLNPWFGFFCLLLGIKQRVGLDYRGRGKFLTHKIPFRWYEGKPVAEYYLDLLRAIAVPVQSPYIHLPVDQAATDWAKQFLSNHGVGGQGRNVIGLVPGGGDSWGKNAEMKRWPSKDYAKLADKLIENFSADIILLGSKSEVPLCAQVQKMMEKEACSICGKSTILQFAALARQCDLVIVNDGGPLHIAAAAGAKTVSIFGPVDEKVYGAYTKQKHVSVTSDVCCRPCYRMFRKAQCNHFKCLSDIPVDKVFNAVSVILKKININR